ncbi:MAG TPA: Glu/Leu/Phe/Val dehydrogenase dimerization domain-containing protein [Acidimicrobiales bacterium]|nr:Glu/Leu/Phe/Val dehydrogenase dimerization domain-containing protein [Acidimicrobiales bacterium]
MTTPPVASVEGLLEGAEHEQVVFGHDRDTGLRAIIAIHSTALGPALGGTRFKAYPDLGAAVQDVLRLARAMTYKNAAAGLDFGGGKAVIVGDPAAVRSEELIRSYARHVHRLGGAYLTAEDVGTTQADMDLIRQETRYVTGTSPELGGSGDPSEATAVGLFAAMKAVAAHLWSTDDIGGRSVTISGVGKVGSHLAALLAGAGARVAVADVNAEAARRTAEMTGAETVDPDAALSRRCDIVSPCALGGVLDAESIPKLQCRAVVGAANNQLADDSCAPALAERGILYAPDFLVNAGGVINISEEVGGYDRERALARVAGIGATLTQVLQRAASEGTTPLQAAIDRAEERLGAARVRAAGR